MRVAIIVVGIVLVATPSHASKSCMTLTEARQHFGSLHLYWHGPGHCWDATAPRNGLVHRTRQPEQRQVERENPAPQNREPQNQEQRHQEATWREAMSEMFPNDATPPVTAPRWAYEAGDGPSSRVTWLERWVDVVQIAPRAIAIRSVEPTDPSPTAGRTADPMVTPTRVILAFLALVLTLAIIELLFRSTIYERRN